MTSRLMRVSLLRLTSTSVGMASWLPTQSQQPDNLRGSVIDRFGKVADTPSQERKFPVGPESAKKLGYEHAEVDALPSAVTESFCGVGNPFSLCDPRPGQTVLDLGCGAGLDTLLAARKVAPNGKVIGLDVTPAMVGKAHDNATLLGARNVQFLLGESESIPLPDSSVDLVISNGVLNLCPDKPRVLGEVFRVLKSGGRLQMADILLEHHVTPEEAAVKGSWCLNDRDGRIVRPRRAVHLALQSPEDSPVQPNRGDGLSEQITEPSRSDPQPTVNV
jgi:arsenite methyltransferase